jgi:hypothetical protein
MRKTLVTALTAAAIFSAGISIARTAAFLASPSAGIAEASASEIRVATVVCGGNGCAPVQTKAYQKRKQFQAMGHG